LNDSCDKILILLWGISGDDPLAAVYDSLLKLGASVVFLDQLQTRGSQIDLSVEKEISGSLRIGSKLVELSSIGSAYIRPYDSLRIKAAEVEEKREEKRGKNDDSSACDLLNFDDAVLCWAELTLALVVNRPSAMASNNSKPYQSNLIRSQGIDIPETLISTDEQAVLEFWKKHRKIIYKSLSGFRSIVSQLKPEDKERLKNVSTCPTQFQEYLEGVNYRVHVVGEEIFTSRIISRADDYRYAWMQGYDVHVSSCALPDDVSERCIRLAQSLHLSVAGIDLLCTREGRWYCFEVNPSPGFTFYQEATGQAISDSIAHLLLMKK
jgi:glutathione synthase/RimK-type ligase-like ATP-grasp enzyme